MRILLLGANGQVGFELERLLGVLGSLHVGQRNVRASAGPNTHAIDLAAPGQVAALVRGLAPDVVVNAAAYTRVDAAEDDADACRRINALAVGEIARACADTGALLVHYSTDYVFPGDATSPYREDDPCAPSSVYGLTKYEGEELIRASGCEHWILRTSWVYGARGNNFLRTMLRLATERPQLRVVDDQRGAPTSSRMIAAATFGALARRAGWTDEQCRAASGTFHLVASGATTWHGFATRLLAEARETGLLAHVPLIEAVTSREFPTRARRPAYSVLSNQRFCQQFGLTLPDWHEELSRVISELADRAPVA